MNTTTAEGIDLRTTLDDARRIRYFIGEQPYALILSPKDSEIKRAKWGATKKNVTGAHSYVDGLANTIAIVEAGSKLAKDIRALRIGGFDDWYLPSRLESLLLFGELQSEFEPEWYWTSTQYAGYAECAWIQDFYNGDQCYGHKDYESRARAVRRVAL
jgi:hypothetical protein